MSLPLRIVLLGACVAAGIGLAWAVAVSLAPPEKAVAAADDKKPSLAETAAPAQPAPAPPNPWNNPWGAQGPTGAWQMQPVVAPVHPAVAQQIDSLERNLRTIKDSQEDSALELQKVLREIRQSQSQPQPVAAPGDAAPAAAPPAAAPVAAAPPAGVLIQPAAEANLPPVTKSEVKRGEGDANLTIHMQDEDIRIALEKLATEGAISIIPSRSVTGTVNASLENVDVMTALDVIVRQAGYVAKKQGNFIYVGTAEDFATLDRANDKIGSRIYRPNYVKASEIKLLIEGLLTPQVGKVTVSTTAAVGIAADSAAAGGDAYAGTEVVMVRDYEAVLAQVDQIVCDVDIQPQQVAIEAMILSVKLADKNTFGVDFALLRDQAHVRLISGSPLADLANIDTSKGGLKFGFLDSSTALFISALESIGDTNVVASPHLMCLNKQRAEILIGSQLGYVSTTVTETAATQSVQFLEVGTQLRLRPYITSDGMIRMEVHPELSTGSVKIEGQFTLPNKEVTQVTTNIMVRDGSTVIIGGLIREDLGTAASQIPYLGSLPALGPLFRQKTEDTSRHEIIVLITPRIVREPLMGQKGLRAECDFLQRQYVYAEKMSPLGKRYLGRRYLRMAKAARANGDIDGAVKLAHLAIHFDPLNREAVDFRGVVIQESPTGDQAARPLTRVGVIPCPPDAPCPVDELPPELMGPQGAPLGGPPGPWNDAGSVIPEELLDQAPPQLPTPAPEMRGPAYRTPTPMSVPVPAPDLIPPAPSEPATEPALRDPTAPMLRLKSPVPPPASPQPSLKPMAPLRVEPAQPLPLESEITPPLAEPRGASSPSLPPQPLPTEGSKLRVNPALIPPLIPASTNAPRRVPVR